MMRSIGRDRSEASPVKIAVTGWPEMTPINRRTPVPELPMSMTSSGAANPPMPHPKTCQVPSSSAGYLRAEPTHGKHRSQHIVALKKAGDAGFANAERAKH